MREEIGGVFGVESGQSKVKTNLEHAILGTVLDAVDNVRKVVRRLKCLVCIVVETGKDVLGASIDADDEKREERKRGLKRRQRGYRRSWRSRRMMYLRSSPVHLFVRMRRRR